jgi:prolipoprotein diacylglyceryltransferase
LASQLSGTPLGVPLVPTQLIDSLTQFLTFFFLIFVLSKKKFDGQVVALFLIAFGTGRGILEYVRGDRGLGVAFPGPFDLNQYASLGLAAIGLGIVAIQLVSGILRGKSFVPAGPVIPWSERRK